MYLNAYISPCPAYGWAGAPGFQTRIVTLSTGRERRNADWAQPRHRYTISFLNITKEEHLAIKKMVMACRGMLHTFRFVDQLDHTATDDTFGIGDGTKTEFQLGKFSIVDGLEYYREVYALPSDPTIKVEGSVESGVTIDQDRGIVTFDSAPANGAVLKWTGSFDMWVRFNADYSPFTLDAPNAVNGQIDLMEDAPPPPEAGS